jgi:hypothetical protein
MDRCLPARLRARLPRFRGSAGQFPPAPLLVAPVYGAAGLLTNYLQQSLERYTATELDVALLAMLSLADPSADRRLAEGKSPEQLAEVARTSIRQFRPVLDYLASPAVRILETWSPPEAPLEIRYRLPHERLISPLRRLSGRLVAEGDRVLLDFQQALQTWIARGKRARDLLSGRELRQVERHGDIIIILSGPGDAERSEFLNLSLRGRNRRWALGGITTVTAFAFFFVGSEALRRFPISGGGGYLGFAG